MKAHLFAILAAVRAYRSTIVQHREAKAKRERDRLFMEAAKRDPLSILFQAKFCQLSQDEDRIG